MSEANVEKIKEAVRLSKGKTVMDQLGIEITYVGLDAMRATMPVDHRTVQPFNLLHGGASVLLAETLASYGGGLFVDLSKQNVVGLEINANHVRGVQGGVGNKVYGEAKPIHVGRKTQVWAIEIKNEKGQLVCTSRCTLAVVELQK